MLKFGIVSQIDATSGRVKVKFGSDEGLESYWLHVLAANTQNAKFYAMPEVGSGVACHVDEHCENGVVMGTIYSQTDTPPVTDSNKFHVLFKDGTWLEYDQEQHKLTGQVQGAVALEATGAIQVSTEKTLILEAAQEVLIRTPHFLVQSLDGKGICNAEWNANMILRGQLTHIGDYNHTGDQDNQGDVSVAGDIITQGDVTVTGNISADTITGAWSGNGS